MHLPSDLPIVSAQGTTTYPEWVRTESEQRLHDDFRVFCWLIWRHLKLPTPSPLQADIASYLQNGPRRRMIQAFRGCGKSWLTAAYVLWRLYRNPEERILVVSANEDRAIQFATFVRRLIDEVEQLQFLRPKGGRDSVQAFDVGPASASQSPSVRAAGITGQITGGRATLIVSDDVEVPKNSLTEAMRERLAEAIKEYDAVLVPGGEVVYLGTPQTEQSIYRTVRARGYDCRVWPARYPTPEQSAKYDGALAPMLLRHLGDSPRLVGTSTEPSRFTDLDLAEREASYGKSGFALQFMLDTSLSDAERYPLKTSDLVCMDIDAGMAPSKIVWSSDPRLAWADIPNIGFQGDRLYRPMHTSETLQEYQGRLMVIDPSGRGGDETAWVILLMLNGTLFLRDWGGFRSGYDDETLEGLAKKARQHSVNQILVESNFGDGMFIKLLEPWLTRVYPCSTEEVRASQQKERRIIEDVEPVLNQHRLVIDAKRAREDASSSEETQRYSLLYQLTHLTKDRGALRHDDRLDALSHGVRYFRDQLAVDGAKAEQRHLDRLKDEQLREFMKGARGAPRKTGPLPRVLRRTAGRRG